VKEAGFGEHIDGLSTRYSGACERRNSVLFGSIVWMFRLAECRYLRLKSCRLKLRMINTRCVRCCDGDLQNNTNISHSLASPLYTGNCGKNKPIYVNNSNQMKMSNLYLPQDLRTTEIVSSKLHTHIYKDHKNTKKW